MEIILVPCNLRHLIRARLAWMLLVAMPALAAAQQGPPPLSRWHHTAWMGDAAPPKPPGAFLHRSSDGYLWLSAFGGLLRFDGVRFTFIDSSAVHELRSRSADAFIPYFTDTTGAMWVQGPSGLFLSYLNGRFRITLPTGSGVNYIEQDGSGRLWALTTRLHTLTNGVLTPAQLPPGVPDSGITSIRRDNANGLWIGTRTDGLWHVTGGTAQHYAAGRITPLKQTTDGALWAYVDVLGGALHRLVDGKWSEVRGPDNERVVLRRIVEQPDGSIWLATNHLGVLRWRDGIMERFSTRNGLSSYFVNGLFAAEEGAVWVSTDAGVERLRPSTFVSLDSRHGLPDDRAPESFVPDVAGGIWVETLLDSVVLLDGEPVRRQADRISSKRFAGFPNGTHTILAPSRAGGVWVSGLRGELAHYTSRGIRVLDARVGLPGRRIDSGIEARDGTVWIKMLGGEFGRVRNGRYRRIELPHGDAYTRSFIEDGLGRVWVGIASSNYLLALDGDSVVAEVTLPARDSVHFRSITLEGGDTLWVAGNVSLFRIIGGRAVEVRAPALTRHFTVGVKLAVTAGQLWVVGSEGVARVPLSALNRVADGEALPIEPRVFSALDGVPNGRISAIHLHPVHIAPDGRVWVITQTGLAVGEPSIEYFNRHSPNVHIEEVSVGDTVRSLSDGGAIPPNPGRVAIRFAAPMLGLPERGRVEYRLDGADESWIEGKPPRIAAYNQLGPGRYRFRVRAWNEDGVPSAGEATLSFRVLPAWYQASWFFALIGVVLISTGGGVVGAVQRRRSQRASRNAQARFDAVLAERTRLAGELHDTLLQAFTGVTLQLQALRGRMLAAPNEAEQDLGRMLKVADVALRDARSAVWDMRSPELGERDVAAALQESAHDAVETHRSAGGAPVDLEVTITGDRRRLSPAVETVAHRIGREAVVNALRHADARHIRVAIAFERRDLCVDVRDDGIGFDAAQLRPAEGRGHWGLVGMGERARSARGTLDVRSAPGTGTAVKLRVPVDSA